MSYLFIFIYMSYLSKCDLFIGNMCASKPFELYICFSSHNCAALSSTETLLSHLDKTLNLVSRQSIIHHDNQSNFSVTARVVLIDMPHDMILNHTHVGQM